MMCGFVFYHQWNVLNVYFCVNFQYKNYLGQEYLVNMIPKILQNVENSDDLNSCYLIKC